MQVSAPAWGQLLPLCGALLIGIAGVRAPEWYKEGAWQSDPNRARTLSPDSG